MKKGESTNELRISKAFLKVLNASARKPSKDETIEMLADVFNGVSQTEVANKYNVSQQAISRAKLRMEELYWQNQNLLQGLKHYTIDLHPSLVSEIDVLLKKNEVLLNAEKNSAKTK
jgi:predicted DNA-binding protein YlxM (UPF0122 family)